jgi:hypothetical protein
MSRPRKPITYIISKLPAHVKIVKETYKGTKIKAKFIDLEFGEFWAIPYDVICGHGHRKRANRIISQKKQKSIILFLKQIPDYLTLEESSFQGMNKKAKFIDKEYGEFEATPKSVTKGKRHRLRAIKEVSNIKLNYEEIVEKLPKNICLIQSTYVNSMTKCWFLDKEYGLFEATPNSIIKNNKVHPIISKLNREKTCLKKYGVKHISQVREIALRQKKSARKVIEKTNWKTGEKIYCIGSYESKVVDYLNFNKIEFKWQIPFKLDIGTYFCDLYLIEKDLYIEIKGWWRQNISKEKWILFHDKFPNSELWDRDKLKALKIL